MKKRRVFLLVLTLLTIAAVCYGIVSRFGLPSLTVSDGDFFFGYHSEGDKSIRKETGPFSGIDIKLKEADVCVRSGEKYSITYRGDGSLFPSYEVDKKTLVVTDPSSAKKPKGLLTVTVPKKLARLSEISVKAENGDITVAPSPSLSADKLTVSSDNGDIVMRNILGASLVASSDNGDITAERISFETSDLSSENGDLIISPSDGCSAYRYHLSGGNGDIRIGDGIYQGTLDSGNGLIAGDGAKDMTLEADNGDIIVK